MANPGYRPVPVTEEQKLQNKINSLKGQLNKFNGPVARLNKYAVGTPEYNKAAAESKSLNSQIDALEQQLANSKLAKVRDAKQRATDSGNSDEAARLGEELDRLTQIANGSNDPKISGPQYVEGDNFGNTIRQAGLIVDTDENGKSSVRASMEGYAANGSEHFIWSGKGFQSKLPGFSSVNNQVQIGASYNEVEKKILEDAQKKPGGMQALFDRLYKAGLVSKQTRDTQALQNPDFTKGLQYALREYSKKTVRDYEINGIKDPITFDDYMDKQFTPAGPAVSYDSVTTTRDTAASDLDRFFMDYLGTGASKEQHDEYYKQLRALEKKAIRTTTTTQTGSGGTSQNVAGEFIDDIDKMELMRKVAGKALNGSDIDAVLKGGAGAAQAVNSVLAYAKQYGINLNNKDALSYVANELTAGKGDMKKVNAKILAIAKSTYGNLSDVITEDVSLSELASNYKYNMAQVLELNPDSIDVMDPTIQTALKNNGNKGTMNLTDFDRMLRNDPRWGKTKNAREEASKYAYDILKDFGLMA
jgi:hypothetical protein